jgi:glutamate 5-kinase
MVKCTELHLWWHSAGSRLVASRAVHVDDEKKCRERLKSSRLAVVKVGGSSLSDKSGYIEASRVDMLCEQLVALRRRGINVILVSSGAIRSGRAVMQGLIKEDGIPHLQALAAVGQVLLMEAYRNTMATKGYRIAQILLTWDDFRVKKRLNNITNTLNVLLASGVTPIINENDTTAVDEIRFGENDTLSALVSLHMHADLLVILSDIDGLYTGDPKERSSKLISYVESVTPEVEKLASNEYDGFGGMAAKLKAAKLVTEAGLPLVIANATDERVLERLIDGEGIGTIFRPRELR